MTQPTREQIRSIIAECAGVEIERVVPEAWLVGRLRNRVAIAVEIERRMGVIVPETTEYRWHTVSDIYETVGRLSE